jgi:SulP family sulfate permease
MIGLVAITMLICFILPLFTKLIPAPLVSIGVCMAFEYGLSLGTITVGDKASVSGSFPRFRAPSVPFDGTMLGIIFPYSIIMAVTGLLETLMLLSLLDDITETKGQPNRECAAQGLGNILCGFFGAMGGCAMLGQAMINISSGGRGRISGNTQGDYCSNKKGFLEVFCC